MAIPVTASANAATKITQLYVGMFGRAPDAEGLNFWGGALDGGQPLAQIAQAMFGTTPARAYFPAGSTSEEVVHEFYVNVLGRQPDSGGLAFWVARLDALKGIGDVNAVGQVITEIISIVANYQGNDPAGVESAQLFANKIAVAEFYTSENGDVLNSAKPIALVNSDPASVNQVKAQILNGFGDIIADNTFTLKEVVVAGQAGTPDVTAVYWGYNPHNEHDETTDPSGVPADGGIPVADLVNFLTTITGLDLHELGLIDADGVTSFQNVTSLSLSNPLSNTVSGDDNTTSNELVITFADGTVINAEVALGAQYFGFLNNLLFDANGNSRLYEKVIVEGSSGSSDSLAPIKLTPSVNNGGTIEQGYTTAGDDLIVAGRLDLLHGAYIDGGAGRNTLEVDAKGTFAQPTALLNIQEVHVNDLPNWYNDGNGGYLGDSNYPYLGNGSGSDDSYLDLSRAVNLDKLVVTAGGASGDLTIVGIRNGATARLEGGFSNDVTLHYGQGLTGPLTVELLIGQIAGKLNFVHNTDALHLVSLGGSANSFGSEDIGGRLTNLKISGDAALYINGDLDDSFQDATPVTIEASENTKGVDLTLSGSQNVTFVGSQGNDRFSVQTAEYEGQPANDETVTIQGGVGNNYYEVIGADKVSITNADGNNNYEITRDGGTSTDLVTITAGNGANHFEIDRVSTAVLTVGNGNNQFDITSVNGYSYLVGDSVGSKSSITIVAGNGANDMDISADTNIGTVKVTAGNGGNAINIEAATINVTAGTGADDIRVEGRDITVDAGGSGNTITVVGTDNDYTDGNYGALIKINAGTNSVVNLGSGSDPQSAADDDFPGIGNLIAKVGSSITGTNITLVVDTVADLRAATLSGITKIVLDDDNATYANSSPSNTDTDKALLTLTDKQVAALVASGTTVEVEGGIFNTSAHIKVIVTANLDVTTGAWATWLSSLPASVDLKFEINDGATLKLTAQQLHTKVASGGISIANDGNTDQVSGKVYITQAGLDFDPFNNNDQVRTVIDSREYMGGSLSTDFVKDLNNNGIADEIANGVQRNEWGYNVLVDRVTYGYNRPADAPSYSRLTIDTDVQGGQIGPFSTIETFLRIVGESDFEFTPMKGGIDEWGAPIKGGTAIELGMDKGLPANKFMVDFSDAGGNVTNLALAHFQMAQAIYGNGTANAPARINVEIDDTLDGDDGQDAVASSTAGLVSRGVQTYVVTKIDDSNAGGDDTVEFWTSRVTEDLKTLGLRGNFGDKIIFGNTERGVDFLLEVAYDKFDGYAVGNLQADFARPDGATAVVNVVGLAALPANEVQKVASVVTNGTGLTINVTGGNTVIGSLGGASLDDVALNTANNLTITTTVTLAGLETFDASGVVGDLTMALSGAANGAGFAFTAADGTTTLTLNGVTAGTHSSFSADAAANFNLVVRGESASDLSKATLTNVDTVSLGKVGDVGATVTLSAAQALDIGLGDIKLGHPGIDGTLNIVNLGNQAFSAADLGAGVELGTVTIAAGNVTLNAATVLTDATVTVAAGSTLTLTADQFMALADLDGVLPVGNIANAVINITGLTQAHIDAGFTLSGVSNATGTITLAENVNLADDTDLNGFAVTLADAQTLGVATAAQANGLDVTGGVGSAIKLLFGDLGQLQSIDAAGYNVDDLRFLDSLVSGQNVDAIFTGLLARVEKIVYNNYVSVVDQTVTISAGAVVNGNLFFDRTEGNLELQNFVLNLEGGTRIANVDLGAAADPAGSLQTYLKTVTINSTGTMANPVSGATGNIMGSLTGGTVATENDLLNVTINASQALQMTGVTFTNVGSANGVATLTVTGTSNVNVGALNTLDDDVDGLNVVNNGTGTVTVGINAANIDQDAGNTDALSFTGTGAIVLNVTGPVDLSDDTLTAVSKLVLTNGANVTLTMAQADAIGAGDIVLAQGAASAALNLEGLDGQPFAIANYGAGVTVNLMTLAADPVITLNAATNLTGINGLIVPEGTVLNMTAAQFQQLGNNNGVSGIITGVKADGTTATSNYTVNITDLTQADVAQGFDLSGITSTNITVTLAENVSLSTPSPTPANWDGINLFGAGTSNGADINIGGFQLTLEHVALANGLNITGTAGSVLKFTDIVASAADLINAAGFNVSELHMTAQLIGGQNVDLLFEGLAASVTKVITDDYGYVTGTSQTVVIEGGSTITTPIAPFNHIAFIKQEGGVEILDFTMNLEGGVNLTGNVNLSKDAPGALVPKHLQTVTINSTGTTANVLNGATANVITGSLSAAALTDVDSITAGNQATLENNLLNVTINATQALVVREGVVFNSVTGDDAVTANDNDSAVATLTVNGTANVTLGRVDLTDTDVDGLNVVNNGTGTLALTLDTADSGEALSFTGTGDIALTIDGSVNLSDDVLTAVSEIKVIEGGTLTLSYGQLQSVGAANVTVIDGTDGGTAIGNAALTINGYAGGAFDATALDTHFATVNLVLVNADVTLGAGVNLTNVDSIVVQEGHTLTLTAAQFQQLQGNGSITSVDTNGNGTQAPINIVITGLTQADVDMAGGFNLSGVNVFGGNITVSLGQPTVNLGTFNSAGTLVPGSAAVLNGADFVLAANETLGLVNYAQANGLDVTGGANTTIIYKFTNIQPVPFVSQIDASGYNVTVLKALAASFTNMIGSGNANVEYSIDDLASSVELRLYEDPAALGFLDPTFRKVVIEAGITTPTGLVFNDWDTTDEVRTLSLTMEGGVTLNGNLSIPTLQNKAPGLVQRYFDTLTIHSEGATTNTINGNIGTGLVTPLTTENNILKVVIDAQQNLVVSGAGTTSGNVVFSYNPLSNLPPVSQAASFVVTGTANVTVDRLDVSDGDISTLNITNTSTGTLTVTGSSPAIFDNEATIGGVGNVAANLEVLTFSGTGNIVIGDADLSTAPTGLNLANLSVLDASGLSGNLSLGQIENIDSASFKFTSGSGVTSLTLTDAVFTGYGADNVVGGSGLNADGSGWNFDFSNAAAGSAFHLNAPYNNADVGVLKINLGANTTLYIDSSMDLTGMDLTILQTQNIVLADGAVLTLTADQANGLNIVAGPDTGTAGISAKVNIVDLTNDIDPNNPVDAFDLSGIAQNIAGTIIFKAGVNDVTLDKMTDLGFFSVSLGTLVDETTSLTGQTIRFQNVAQAERVVIAVGDLTPATGNSSNVVWLFDNITAPVDTRGYFSSGPLDPVNKYATAYTIGRLWMTEALINNEGGDVEQLFTTLPSAILRVDFTTLTALNILLGSAAVDRTVEMVHFTNLGNLTFSDVGLSPVEHLHSLNLQLGGQVTIGNINLDDVVGAPGYDPATVTFTALTIESRLALHQDNYLAAEAYVNNDNGANEVGENLQPLAVNTIGNISVGSGLDLLTINLKTFGVAAAGNSINDVNDGAVLNIGTITYGARTPATPTVQSARLNVSGDNNVNIASVVVTDADITGPVLVDLSGFSATLSAPGTSPAFVLGAQIEQLTFIGNQATAVVNLGSSSMANPNAGVSGAGLSKIDASGFPGTLNLGILALIDGTNDDSTPVATPLNNDGLVPAFTLKSGPGITTATLAKDPDSANVPSLAAGSEWIIDYTNAAAGSRLTITDAVVFGAPANPGDPLPKLTLKNVDLYITGNVDLTGVDLSGIDGNSDIFVPAGNTLTLTALQAEALVAGVEVTGDGTVRIVGDLSDTGLVGLSLELAHIRTVNVDVSAATISANVLVDVDGQTIVNLFDGGAINDAGTTVGFNFVGSAFADAVDASNFNDTINGGVGNDNLTGKAGSDTFLVTAGTDTITDLLSVSTVVGDHDVLVVSAGATAVAAGITAFVATAATVNNGTANLSTNGGTIDVSAAGGTNGFNLTGGALADQLIGSNQADMIIGGGNDQAAGVFDTMTGNGGADIFRFTTSTSTPQALTVETVADGLPNRVGVDWERVNVSGPANATPGTITIGYSVNGAALPANIVVTLVGGETPTAIAALISAQFLAAGAGFSTLVTGGAVEVRGATGNSLTLLPPVVAGTDAAVASTALAVNADVAQITRVELSHTGAIVAGETYSLALTLTGTATAIQLSYTAQALDTWANVTAGLTTSINALGGAAISAVSDANGLTITDTVADNGGFSITASSSGGFNGSSASDTNADDWNSSDVITDFVSGTDKVDFQGLVAGSAANYAEAAQVADYVTALANANTAMNGTVRYYLTSVLDIDGVTAGSQTTGVLFFDADADGVVDGAVRLTGVSDANFAFGDITASV